MKLNINLNMVATASLDDIDDESLMLVRDDRNLCRAKAEWNDAMADGADEETLALLESEVMAAEEACGIEVGGPESAVTVIRPKFVWKPSPELLAVAEAADALTCD